ncbi:MAG: deaminase [Chloroflexi bacterium]|nr:deaminase [Chloroflexota bacterium]
MDASDGSPDYTALEFPEAPADRPCVIVNMVASADGKTVIEGSEQGLGSATDRRLMRELRLHADIVLTGAGTLRTSGHTSRLNDEALEALRVARGKPRLPIAATLTHSGDLPLDNRFFTGSDFEGVVYLSDGAPAERADALATTGRAVQRVPEGAEAPAMLAHMREALGCRLLLLEGGPTLNGEFFRRGLVDELFLTLGALVVGGDAARTAVETPGHPASHEGVRRLALLSAYRNPETSELYLRYRVRRPAEPD